MSESTNHPSDRQTSLRGGRPGQRPSSNPLGDSPLLAPTSAPPGLPALPTGETSSQQFPSGSQPPPVHFGEQKPALLYSSPVPPEFMVRPFEQQHDRQTIYIDARKAGALDALVKLVSRGNKTDLVAEMVDDIIAKYAQLLQANEGLVRLTEEKYRKKHNL